MRSVTRKLIMRFVVFAATVSLCATTAFGENVVYTPADRSFSITFPGTPDCSSAAVTFLGESQIVHTCTYANKPAGLYYSVMYFDRPRASLGVDPMSALRAARDGALEQTNSQLVAEREITVDGYSGLECAVRGNDVAMASTTRFVITDRQLVVVDVSGTPGKMPDELVRPFLESLHLAGLMA